MPAVIESPHIITQSVTPPAVCWSGSIPQIRFAKTVSLIRVEHTIIDESPVVLLGNAYSKLHVEDPGEITRLLNDRPDIFHLILSAQPEIDNTFGADATVSLEISEDPEENESILAVLLSTPDGWEADLDRLQAFNERWWFRRASQLCGDLVFMVGID